MPARDTQTALLLPARLEEYREEVNGKKGDYRWRVRAHTKEILADSSEGYRNRKDMRRTQWSILDALLRWAHKVDRVRLNALMGSISTND